MSLGRAPVAVRFLVAALGCCLSVSVAHAQVIRCTEAVSGKVTYTDGSPRTDYDRYNPKTGLWMKRSEDMP